MKRINQILTVFIIIVLGWGIFVWIKVYNEQKLQKLAENHPQGQEYVDGIKEFEKQLKDNNRQNDYEALFNIAFNRAALEDYEGAIKYYKKALENTPNSSLAKWNLANIYKNLDQKEEAEKLYKQCIKKEPKNMQYYNGLGELYRGWPEKKLEEPSLYLKALQDDKENIGLMKLLVEYFRSINDMANLEYWEGEILKLET